MKRMLLKRWTAAMAAAVTMTAVGAAGQHAEAQSRFRVLVPDYQPLDGARSNWGGDLAKELRSLIDGMDTHASVDARELNNVVRGLRLRADTLKCNDWRQIAVRMRREAGPDVEPESVVQIVNCGSYRDTGNGMLVEASFSGVLGDDSFEIEPFTESDARAAARTIFEPFQNYVGQLRLAVFCVQNLSSGLYQEALRTCEQALELNPNSITALYGRSEALLRIAEEGENGGSQAPALGGEDTDLDAGDIVDDPLGTNGGERSEEYMELMRRSLEGFERVLEVNPIHEQALISAGYVATKLGQNERALGYYERLLELDPQNVDVRLQRAQDLARAGNPAGALRLAEEGFEFAPDNVSLKEYAGHYALAAAQELAAAADPTATRYFERALEYYQEAFEAHGEEASPVLMRGMLTALTRLERFSEAAHIGARFVEGSEDAGLWLAYADVLARSGNMSQAVAALERVAALDPNAPVDRRRATWLMQSGDVARARQVIDEAVRSGQMTGNDASNLVFSYAYNELYQKGQHNAALDLFGVARQLATSAELQARANFFSAYIHLQRGVAAQAPETAASARQALPHFQRALELFRASTAYREQASRLQSLIGQTQQFIEIQQLLIQRGR